MAELKSVVSPEPAVERDGFAIVPRLLDEREVAEFLVALEAEDASAPEARSVRRGSVYGTRNMLAVPAVRVLIAAQAIQGLMTALLGAGCRAVRGILFDKTPDANWHVPWHQDLSIAVEKRPTEEIPGWGPWSEKAGVVHVQPPADVLARLLTIRIHLDACPAENGALRVLPGTQRLGRLTPADITRLRTEIAEEVCAVEQGGALLMRPLLLHASSPAQLAGHRRVLHLEFAPADLQLPEGLEWQAAVGQEG